MEIEDVIKKALHREQERQLKQQDKVKKLTAQLQSDPEYQRYRRAHRLYRESHAQQLWENYLHVDGIISRKRSERGQTFEKRACELYFEVIVKKYIESHAVSDDNNKDLSDFSYELNEFWRHHGKRSGEIDLAIFDKRHQVVVAVCEMKTSCFEISSAMRQHESKLSAATAESNGKGGPNWSIGQA